MNRILTLFGYGFYVKELLVLLLAYLMMENIFSWLVIPNSVILLAYEKILSLLIFGYVLYKFTNLQRNEKIYTGLFSFLILRLIFESLLDYGNVFQQLTLFTVLFPVVFTIFIKCVCRSLDLDLLEFLAKFYLYVYIAVMIIYGRGFSFSLQSVDMNDYGPFSGDSRIIHARSVLMMIIPMLWAFSRLMETKKLKFLAPLLFTLTVILVHQHRSVWASAIVALLVFMLMSTHNGLISTSRVAYLSMGIILFLTSTWVVLAYFAPSFTNLLTERFSEILDPTREGGTGKFREDQREIYFALFLKRPVFGWTFEGFDMPNPLVDWWPAKSGQHFHEGYMEMLFYHGIAGVLLKYWSLVYISFKAFSKKLSRESIVMIAFSISGLIFSFSYVLPLVFWGHVGLCLYYMEKKPVETNLDEELDEVSFAYTSDPLSLS